MLLAVATVLAIGPSIILAGKSEEALYSSNPFDAIANFFISPLQHRFVTGVMIYALYLIMMRRPYRPQTLKMLLVVGAAMAVVPYGALIFLSDRLSQDGDLFSWSVPLGILAVLGIPAAAVAFFAAAGLLNRSKQKQPQI